jgi:hypothetical protein
MGTNDQRRTTMSSAADCDDHNGCVDAQTLARWESRYTNPLLLEYLSDSLNYYYESHAIESWRVYGVDYRALYKELFDEGGKYDSQALRDYLSDVEIYNAVAALKNVIIVPNKSLEGADAQTGISYAAIGPRVVIVVEQRIFSESKSYIAKVLLHEFGHAITDSLRLNANLPKGYIKREEGNLRYVLRNELSAEALAIALLSDRRPDSKAYEKAKKWLQQTKDQYGKYKGRGALVIEYQNEIAIALPDIDDVAIDPDAENAPVRTVKIETEQSESQVNPYDGATVRESGLCGKPGIVCEFSPDGKLVRLSIDFTKDVTVYLPPDLAGKLDAPREPGCRFGHMTLADYKRARPPERVLTLFYPPPQELHLIPIDEILGFDTPGRIDRLLASQPDSSFYFLLEGLDFGFNVGGGGGRTIEIRVDPE